MNAMPQPLEAETDVPPMLRTQLKGYAAPDRKRSIVQLSLTLGFFVLTWVAMWASLQWHYGVTLLLAVVGAGFLVRLFMIQHDCAHGSFFKSRISNDLVGRALGVLTMTPYGYWRKMHADHHANAGNLDRRGVGDVTTLTVEEFLALPWWRRAAYRMYRHPIVLFGLGPFFLFVLKHRAPLDLPLREKKAWLSVLGTNLALGLVLTGLTIAIGPLSLLKMQGPIMLLASTFGVWLFFIQHQFKGVYWRRQDEWRHDEAALHGSSYYALPRPLEWLTAYIGLHHVHHLCSRIPNYRLRDALVNMPELRAANRVGFFQSLGCATLALWDEANARLVRFRDLRHFRRQH
jgi:acyl-lipid omega-6 desaturase (Delta-12 desaturase)